MSGLSEAANQHQRIWNAILAPSWGAAQEILQAEPDSPLQVHVLELFDAVHNMGRMTPELLFSCVDETLDDLGNSVPTEVVASLRNSIRTCILPWGVIPRVLRGDLSINETNVAQVLDSYHWPLGLARDHVQQVLLSISNAMQDCHTVTESQQPTEEQRQIDIDALRSAVQPVDGIDDLLGIASRGARTARAKGAFPVRQSFLGSSPTEAASKGRIRASRPSSAPCVCA